MKSRVQSNEELLSERLRSPRLLQQIRDSVLIYLRPAVCSIRFTTTPCLCSVPLLFPVSRVCEYESVWPAHGETARCVVFFLPEVLFAHH